jgi:hypothetical protein
VLDEPAAGGLKVIKLKERVGIDRRDDASLAVAASQLRVEKCLMRHPHEDPPWFSSVPPQRPSVLAAKC